MNKPRQSQGEAVLSEEVRAQAAAWIAQLHDEKRSPNLEAQIHAWLGESENHRRAFDRMKLVWERAGQIRLRARGDTSAIRSGRRARFPAWAAALAASLLVVVVAAVVYHWHDNALVTGVGQRDVRLLPDGTRVVLNTNTRVEVKYDERARRVRLIRGEARFDVSKRPTWPFIVSVNGQAIRALGTSFIVRQGESQDLSVTLVEGRISVTPIARNDEAPVSDPQVLQPGQRLVLSQHHAPAVDRPELTRITAWERGSVDFDNTPLKDAANEMNRYTTTRITVPDAEVAQLRIGGVFHAGNADEFVKIATQLFGLRADRNGGDIVLSRSATPARP